MPECIYKRLELGLLEHGIDTWWQYWFEFQATKIHTYSIYSVRNGFRSNFVSEDRILQVGPQVKAQHSTNLVEQMNIVSISLNGRVKSGQRWSGQNRPTDVARDSRCFTLSF